MKAGLRLQTAAAEGDWGVIATVNASIANHTAVLIMCVPASWGGPAREGGAALQGHGYSSVTSVPASHVAAAHSQSGWRCGSHAADKAAVALTSWPLMVEAAHENA
jgi:hypothetical protein